jgi:peptide/nickel transport system substrate-binding protein
MIQPLFDGRNYADGSTNYGDYNNPEVNKLIDQAIQAKSADEAEPIWKQANAKIMADAPIAPMISINWPIFRSARVKGAIFNSIGQGYDYTTLWLQ